MNGPTRRRSLQCLALGLVLLSAACVWPDSSFDQSTDAGKDGRRTDGSSSDASSNGGDGSDDAGSRDAGSSSDGSASDASSDGGGSSDAGSRDAGSSSDASAGSPPVDIHTFVACLNTINSTRVSDAVACLPSNCYVTITTSTISAQPGCTLNDGTQLPRIDYSCPGPAGSRNRFRPSFTLCTKGGAINHIEVVEDVNSIPDQKMGDINSSLGFQTLTEFGPGNSVVDTSTSIKGCGECHAKKGTVSTGGTIVNLYEDIPPDRGILFLNDPNGGNPVNKTPLSEICTRLASSSQLAGDDRDLAIDLCNALLPKTPKTP